MLTIRMLLLRGLSVEIRKPLLLGGINVLAQEFQIIFCAFLSEFEI